MQTAIEEVLAALGNLHAVLFQVGDIIHPRMRRVTPIGEQFPVQAVALDGFPQPNRMPAVAFANEHGKHPGIGIVRHRQHSASEIAHHIGQIGVTAGQHKGI